MTGGIVMAGALKSAGLRFLRRALQSFGYDVHRTTMQDLDKETLSIIERVRPFTMTSDERLAALCISVAYVVQHAIAGDFVECGVWKGGSTMAAALTFSAAGDTSRRLHLFDTFEGMSEPTDADRSAVTG